MKAYILFTLLIITTFTAHSQKNEKIYVLIEQNINNELYLFKKWKNKAQIKIIYYEKRNKGFKKTKNNSKIIKVEPMPNKYFYEFNSVKSPEKLNDLTKIKFLKIIDISKHKVWNTQYPNNIFFIEKTNSNCYYIWEMVPKVHE